MGKNILLVGVNSELAQDTIKQLKKKDFSIYATSRNVGLIQENIHEFHLDVTKEEDFIHLKEKFRNVKFDVIINFAGIAVSSPVIELKEEELKKQLDVNLYGLLRIIKYFSANLNQNGKLINISSMASYGIFPFISPYCLSKSSADILLNALEIESGIKTVSIRPGAVATKFWESSIELNKNTFENLNSFESEKKFLLANAQKNSLKATNSIYVAKKIAKIIETKKPKSVYNIGLDSKIAKLTRFLPSEMVIFIVKNILKIRTQKKNNEK